MHQQKSFTFTYSVLVCCIQLSQPTETVYVTSINNLVFITDTDCHLYYVKTELSKYSPDYPTFSYPKFRFIRCKDTMCFYNFVLRAHTPILTRIYWKGQKTRNFKNRPATTPSVSHKQQKGWMESETLWGQHFQEFRQYSKCSLIQHTGPGQVG
jgi:hypothetical protein